MNFRVKARYFVTLYLNIPELNQTILATIMYI